MNRNDNLAVLMLERTQQIALAKSILRQSQLARDVYQDTVLQRIDATLVDCF